MKEQFLIRRDTFDLGSAGYCSMDWPDKMTDDQLADFHDWIDLMRRKVTRIAREALTTKGNSNG